MRILGMNPGHDGAVALLEDGALQWVIEAEKDSFRRNGETSVATILSALEELDTPPDVIAFGGWEKNLRGFASRVGAGYHGLEPPILREAKIMGHEIVLGVSSHERSHIFAGLGMSQTTADDLVALTWEGDIGAFYRVRRLGEEITRIPVLHGPGHRFGFLYCLADPDFLDGDVPLNVAGKLMALAGFGDAHRASPEAKEAVDRIMAPESAWDLEKSDFRHGPLWNCTLDADDLRDAARLLADRIFESFRSAIVVATPPGLPLLIGGGCGLNCEWNTQWFETGHFSEVFVPPCPNDSGSAIGTAVDVMRELGLGSSIDWSVYSGPHFVHDIEPPDAWTARRATPEAVANLLASGVVVPFVQGRAEVGPRALGHRSILASPSDPAMTHRLNEIKGRESYRPIAPCCRLIDFDRYFTGPRDPFMLFFDRVHSDRTPATTHIDGSARVQVVAPDGGPLDRLLGAMASRTGTGVLCNTSLNFPGRGFINRMSELVGYCESRGLDAFVVDDRLWSRTYRT